MPDLLKIALIPKRASQDDIGVHENMININQELFGQY